MDPQFDAFLKPALDTNTPIMSLTPQHILSVALSSNQDVGQGKLVITQGPEGADAYYQKASAEFDSLKAVGGMQGYMYQLDQVRQDLDKAIELNLDNGDYYALRESVYFTIAVNSEYEVDNQYLANIALENAIKADKLGTKEQFPERRILVDQIYAEQCQQSLDGAQKQIAKLSPTDDTRGGF